MEQTDLKATELDKMTCSYNLQMLKAALSYFPPQPKRFLSIFIKAQELKNTFRLISSPENIGSLNICSTPESTPKQGFFEIWNEIKDYGGPEQQKMFDRLNQIIQLSSMYEQMSQEPPGNFGQQTEKKTEQTSGQMEPSMEDKDLPEERTAETERVDSDLAAASLTGARSTPSRPEYSKKPDFRTCIRNSLSPENQALFDSYSAMFHSSEAFSGKET